MLTRNTILIFSVLVAVPSAFSMEEVVVEKRRKVSQKILFNWASSDRVGKRENMEDTHGYCYLEHNTPLHFFCLFDGHGSKVPAMYALRNAASYFLEEYKDNKDASMEIIFEKCYERLEKVVSNNSWNAGTTAVTAVIHDTDLSIAWVGDSRVVVASSGGVIKKETEDHRLSLKREMDRITDTKKVVNTERGPRLGNAHGSIEVSRALGDPYIKKNVSKDLIATPDVIQVALEKGDILIIACDGVWDVLSSQEAVDFVKEQLEKTEKELSKKFSDTQYDCSKKEDGESDKMTLIARGLRDLAYEKESTDNISVILIEVEDII